MHTFLIPLLRGAVLVFSVFGVGSFALRLLKLRTLPWYWHLAFTAILGQGTVNLLVQGLLLSGVSSTSRLRILGWVLILAGLAAFLLTVSLPTIRSTVAQFRNHHLLKTVLVAAWLTNLVVALAPSSKIDELFYHMLVPKRIAAEGSLNYYRLPLEAAIVPQMQYQMSLSPAYALGAPE